MTSMARGARNMRGENPVTAGSSSTAPRRSTTDSTMAALPGAPNHFDVPMRKRSPSGSRRSRWHALWPQRAQGAAIPCRCKQDPGGRLIPGHGDGTTVLHQRHQHIELPGALDELLGAVDWVDDPAPRNAQPVPVVLTFLTEDGVVGKTLAQDVTNCLISGEVRVGYGRPVALGIGRRRFSFVELLNDLARREHGRDGSIEFIAIAR